MKMQELIKQATLNKELWCKLLNDPIQICKKYGIKVEEHCFEQSHIGYFNDQTNLQGGYRP